MMAKQAEEDRDALQKLHESEAQEENNYDEDSEDEYATVQCQVVSPLDQSGKRQGSSFDESSNNEDNILTSSLKSSQFPNTSENPSTSINCGDNSES